MTSRHQSYKVPSHKLLHLLSEPHLHPPPSKISPYPWDLLLITPSQDPTIRHRLDKRTYSTHFHPLTSALVQVVRLPHSSPHGLLNQRQPRLWNLLSLDHHEVRYWGKFSMPSTLKLSPPHSIPPLKMLSPMSPIAQHLLLLYTPVFPHPHPRPRPLRPGIVADPPASLSH